MEPLNKNETPGKWIWGHIYYNTDDKRIFPPKKNPAFGWTVNFANAKSILANSALILFFLLVVLLIEYKKR